MKKAFLFPGQGSQSVGMLAELATAHSVVRDTFAVASEVLGYDLWQLVSDGPKDALDSTLRTQPAMLAAGVATWRLWRELGGGEPDFMAGHSLGEYSALVCAGALSFDAAIGVVEQRAGLMQRAVPQGEGAMAAVLGLSDELVETACEQASEGQVVAAVNYNAPGQVVVAGERDAVGRVKATAGALGARRVLPLPVSVPSHCALMRGAAEEFAEVLATVDIVPAGIEILHNAGPVNASEAQSVRAALCRQLYSPVRWRATVDELIGRGVGRFYECGPGKVLIGLLRRTSREVTGTPLENHKSLHGAVMEQGVHE